MELETVFAGSLSLNDVLLKLGYSALNPMQEQALPLLGEQRLMVSAPTASGKTLLAVLKIAKNFLETKTKALYVVPLRALASEKHAEFERSLASFEMKVAISTGDYDSNSEELEA
ncbi:DEAD/DEAH box helicase, partial [Candidatus Micrarchaeota archaeon]|nr:DEAD/DEAH box helicase [Candidatus Micrarchaeota archaeon]